MQNIWSMWHGLRKGFSQGLVSCTGLTSRNRKLLQYKGGVWGLMSWIEFSRLKVWSCYSLKQTTAQRYECLHTYNKWSLSDHWDQQNLAKRRLPNLNKFFVKINYLLNLNLWNYAKNFMLVTKTAVTKACIVNVITHYFNKTRTPFLKSYFFLFYYSFDSHVNKYRLWRTCLISLKVI